MSGIIPFSRYTQNNTTHVALSLTLYLSLSLSLTPAACHLGQLKRRARCDDHRRQHRYDTGGSPCDAKWRACDVGEAKKGWRMSCDVGEATESSLSNPSVALPTSQLILQPFRCFTLLDSSFSNPSFASPTSQALHLTHGCPRVAHCVTGRWRNVSHYCRPLRLIYVFWAQRSTARLADSTRCTQTVQGGST